MTNAELLAKIKAEIERRKKSLRAGICNEEVFTRKQREEMLVASEELDRLNRFLSTLKSEKPTQEGLEEEYKDYVVNDPVYSKLVNRNAGLVIASHFAQWGADWQKEQEWESPKEDVQTRFAFYTYKDEPEVVYLSNVFVEESSRHQGLGTRILEAAEMVAKTYGATTIRLRVRPDSPAKVWYLNHGYIYMTFEGEYQWLEKYI